MLGQRTRGQTYVMTKMRESVGDQTVAPFYYAGFPFVWRIPLIRYSGASIGRYEVYIRADSSSSRYIYIPSMLGSHSANSPMTVKR